VRVATVAAAAARTRTPVHAPPGLVDTDAAEDNRASAALNMPPTGGGCPPLLGELRAGRAGHQERSSPPSPQALLPGEIFLRFGETGRETVEAANRLSLRRSTATHASPAERLVRLDVVR